MKSWLRLFLLAALCLALALTSRYWFQPVLTVLDFNTDRIQGIDAFLNLLLVGGSLLSAYLGWQQRQKEAAPKTRVKTGDNTTVITDGGKKADSITEIHYHTTPNPADPPPPKLPPDLRQATETYKEHLVALYRYLDFRGMGMSDRVSLRLPLLQMYVPLKAHVQRPEGETWARLAGRPISAQEADVIGQRLSEPLPLLDLVQQHSGLIILGDPGAGKTTFLKYLALHLAQGQGATLGLSQQLPVLLPLSAYANALVDENISLERFIARYYEQERGVSAVLGPMLAEALANGRALLLLDGLDEVKNISQRRDVVNRVSDFFTVQQQRGNKFILTSRIVGYPEVKPTVEGLMECTLIDFNDDDIALFVDKWTAAIEAAMRGESAATQHEAAQEKAELLQAVAHNPGVRRLATNPLLLTVLALIKRQGVQLPEKRAELYERYIDILLRQWVLARGLGKTPTYAPDVKQVKRLLAPLAYWMQQTSPGVGLVKEQALQRELQRILAEQKIEAPEQVAVQFLADVHDHASLLLERGDRHYGFIHLTFQEYLAGVAMARQVQQGVDAVVNALAQHVGDANWREASLLAVGYLAIVQQLETMAGEVLVQLIRRQPEPNEAFILAGEALLDVGADGVTAEAQAVVLKALQVTMTGRSVPSKRRLRAGILLADLEEVPPGLDEFVTVPGWGFQIGRYPVTNLQFERFMAAGGYEQNKTWWSEKAIEEIMAFENRYGDKKWPTTPRYWQDDRFNHRTQPVVGVSWYEANAYCAWLTQALRRRGEIKPQEEARLPTQAEWELVAGGTEKRPYPWGDTFDAACANTQESDLNQTSPVHMYPDGQSPEGVWDLAGNVWEWTSDVDADGFPWLKGGGYWREGKEVRTAVRDRNYPYYRSHYLGFRVVVVPISRG